MMWPDEDKHPTKAEAARQAAVIDIGSNSVRLVIYRLEGRAIWTVFNEKALAGLGRDLPASGRLSVEGVATAMTALRRFRAVLDGWDAMDVTVAATAAVREAADGEAFVRRIAEETGFVVRVLSGEEEAHYAALGVVAGEPSAQGVVGDLGGSSLELIRLQEGAMADGVTLPLGPFALGAPKTLEVEPTRKVIEGQLVPLAGRFRAADFHAVGGAWRNLALLHMELAGYPLKVAHQYEIGRREAVEVARFVERQSKGSLERIPGLSKKRFDTLAYSALVLDVLIEAIGAERIIISAYGVREGLLFEAMSDEARALDPLIAGCEALVSARGIYGEFGPVLEAWLKPAFRKLEPLFGERDGVLLAAACRLADLGGRLHPDHRADIAFEQVLRAPLAGISHAERAFLASVAYARHSSSGPTPDSDTMARILTTERRQRAKALGAAIRLGCDLSGRNPRLLEQSKLSIQRDRLSLRAASGWGDMLLGEQATKRANALAGALKLKLVMAEGPQA